MAMALQLRPRFTILRNTSLVNFFSTSSPNDNGGEDNQSPPPASRMSPFFNDVKASLKQQSPPRRIIQNPNQSNPPLPSSKPSQSASLEEIRKNLSQFRNLSGSLPDARSSSSPPNSNSKPVSLQELYKRNVGNDTAAGTSQNRILQGIKESLKKFQTEKRGGSDATAKRALGLDYLKGSLKIKPDNSDVQKSSVVKGGSETVVPGWASKENTVTESLPKNKLVRYYGESELGEKLRGLRPADAKSGKNWVLFSELNERLIKLRQIEEEESIQRVGCNFTDLRQTLVKLQFANSEVEEKTKRSPLQSLDVLGHLGGTPSYMLSPPKEHLVEKYFHPDNMSSADKLKLELKKIRDEFKMSESDCGSSRVQVAQLTVKIKHLSTALHKKDKHSRKGLQEMVVRRKKLLKYLRRTDWDSYCFCLSKLGLRDNPDYKN